MQDHMPNDKRSAELAGEWDVAPEVSDGVHAVTGRGGLLGRAWVRRYGGHPVAVRIGRRLYGRRLFVGGRERTMRPPRLARARPAIDVIVNVCALADHATIVAPGDCWWPR